MAAGSLLHSSPTKHKHLQPTRLARDLYQIAELVELCFGDRLDASGRSAVREMKTVARLGPLLWILSLLDWVGFTLGKGYVWRENGRVVGNASLYRGGEHPRYGRGWLIANVAVHPDYQRQGIARALMDATIDLARRKGGQWIALQVEADNDAALGLYDDLAFTHFETLHHWKTSRVKPVASPATDRWQIRPRRPDEAHLEQHFILNVARQGAMAWTRPIERSDIHTPLPLLSEIAGTGQPEHWLLMDRAAAGQIRGALWVETSGWRQTRLTLFLDPALDDPAARQLLLADALRRPSLQGRTVRVETEAGSPAVDDLLEQAGFRSVRSLIQMRKLL